MQKAICLDLENSYWPAACFYHPKQTDQAENTAPLNIFPFLVGIFSKYYLIYFPPFWAKAGLDSKRCLGYMGAQNQSLDPPNIFYIGLMRNIDCKNLDLDTLPDRILHVEP